jgi:hypothetical protein
LFITAPAHGVSTKNSAQKVEEIVGQFSTPYIRNAMFRCYHLGRLQGLADILAVRARQFGEGESQDLHAKAEHLLSGGEPPGNIYDCDPQFSTQKPNRAPLQADTDIVTQIRAIRHQLRGFAGEELVIKCFHIGRLSMLIGRLSELIKQQNSGGRLKKLRDASARTVLAKSKDCKAQSIY